MSCQLVVASPLVIFSLPCPLIVLSCQLVVASSLAVLSLRCPLVVLSRQLVVTLPLAVLSLRHPLVNSWRQLFVASPLHILSLRPTPPSRPLVAPAPTGCCVAFRRAALSLSCRLVVPPLVVSSHQLVVVSSYLVVLSLHRTLIPLIVLAGCCVACPCAALSSSWLSPSPMPSNAIKCCCRHRTPPPPPPLNAICIFPHATAAVHRHRQTPTLTFVHHRCQT